MRNLVLMAVVLSFSVPLAYAQSPGEYHKVELYGAYSHNLADIRVDETILLIVNDMQIRPAPRQVRDRAGFNGFNTSVAVNLSRHVGLKFDLSGHFRSDTFRANLLFPCEPAPLCLPPPPQPADVHVRASFYNFLSGAQLKDNSVGRRLKPFAHALVGLARAGNRVTVSESAACPGVIGSRCPLDFTDKDTGFAGAFGGGLDVRAGKRIDIRVIQLDYNPTRLFDGTQHNLRVGAGIVFH
jgi:hypothetical protein